MLENISSDKDLGIFYPKLNFASHINQTVSSVKRMMLGPIFRNCKHFQNRKSYTTLFDTFVRSSIEHGSLAGAPLYSV